MNEACRAASGRFARGFNCAQAIFSAFAEQYGLSSTMALRLTAAFGAGMAREGEVCGGLTGALMVLGLQYGDARPEGKEEAYRVAKEFMTEFRRRHGSLLCREILGHDISSPEGLRAARELGLFATICPLLVDETAKALEVYMSQHPVP